MGLGFIRGAKGLKVGREKGGRGREGERGWRQLAPSSSAQPDLFGLICKVNPFIYKNLRNFSS